MCPGLTSAGGYLPPCDAALPAGTLVAIHAEGKEHAVGVGITKLGTEEMRRVNKGVGVETATYLGDELWGLQTLLRSSNWKGSNFASAVSPNQFMKLLLCLCARNIDSDYVGRP